MRKHHLALLSSGIAMLAVSMTCMTSVYAAKPVNLKFESTSGIQTLLATPVKAQQQASLKEINSTVDAIGATHIRLQETYSGYPVWGADAIIHVKKGAQKSLQNVSNTVSGLIYQDLNADLQVMPGKDQADKAMQHVLDLAAKKLTALQVISKKKSKLMVYVDKANKAHWAYLVSFFANQPNKIPTQPTYIVDAQTLTVYQEWNDLKTIEEAEAGSFGGNEKMGKIIYDGMLKASYGRLNIMRDAQTKTCFMQNAEVIVMDYSSSQAPYQFACENSYSTTNNVYWHGQLDAVNGAYSPAADALFTGKIIKEMYSKWYKVPVLVRDGVPMRLEMCVHERMENAYWDGERMVFGDGGSTFYPLVSLGVAAHEVSHGFTQQHSNLVYSGQSGGLNEAFSDMAAQAAEYYASGKNSWQIGPEIFKAQGEALRYMDDPTKDGASIGHMKDYDDYLDVHYTSGIFNKIFYLIGTAPEWNTKMAFDVMVLANQAYWRSTTDFHNAANCVLKAADDLGYDSTPLTKAFNEVGLYGTTQSNCY